MPTCSCCAKCVDRLVEAGFKTRVTDLTEHELSQLKAKAAVPSQAQSCHTALVAATRSKGMCLPPDVKRLLDEKPAVAGIAVPGMPIGSPGMEVDGMKPAAYQVLTFDKSGTTRTFSIYDRIKE